ncbi:MAG TPA: isopentenyl-diphosphate Delta-isomerase [Chitinophagaceae bacterium]|nr:isopentenyl-diphosphate Delta-isomerase [Chitinophagaceae bacterium]
MVQEVILVDEKDRQTGTMEKMQAHREGKLHRAFSIFIFDEKGRMLLQQRALSKYHSGGLWTNACCSHPSPGESIEVAAARRLQEEMGFETSLSPMFHFTYEAKFNNGLIEHEYDHVFYGKYDGEITPNNEEVMDHEYKTIEEIKAELHNNPAKYTAWFLIAFPRLEAWLDLNSNKIPAK